MKKVIGLTMLICIGLWAAHVENADVFQQRRDLQTHSPASARGIIHGKPQVDPDATRDLLWDQAPTAQGAFHACQWDSTFSFDPEVADNFVLAADATVDSLVWWGGYWNPGAPGPPLDFWIKIYPDSGSGMGPQQTPIYVERVAFAEHVILADYHWYEASIPGFSAAAGVTYWIVFQPTLVYPPQWGNNCDTLWGDGQEHYFKSAYFGYPTWVPATSVFTYPYESSFQLYGTAGGGEITWDFETGWQGWTNTNGNVFPQAWGVMASNLNGASWVCPSAGDSSLWIDSDAAGSGGYLLEDTALSPLLVPNLRQALNILMAQSGLWCR